MEISLRMFFPHIEYDQHKIHFACWNGESQPLDVYVRDRSEWHDWNAWRSNRDDFNRQYIFSLINFYHESDTWLFGGIFEVLERSHENQSASYSIRELTEYDHFVGRLLLKSSPIGRARRVKMESYADDLQIIEYLREPYSGEAFPGYDNLSHDFSTLEVVFKTNRLDWRTPLENTKGVYLIMDKCTGRKYVGSAYGQSGLWARWQQYMDAGHGNHSDELCTLIGEKGIVYARENFRITLLEPRSMRTDDDVIIQRESFWKEALQSRGPFGYNSN